MDILIARQPIFDSRLRVRGYELLHRPTSATPAPVDGDQATSTVATNSIIEIGLDMLVGEAPAFVNVPRNFLVSGLYRSLPEKRVVLEILEDVEPDEDVLAALRVARAAGYRIALDDFCYRPDREPLLDLAHLVKVDILEVGLEEAVRHVELLSRWPLHLLAEKVETHEEFQRCQEAGYRLFQGYFLCRPQHIQQRAVSSDRLTLMRLLAQIHDPHVTFEGVLEIVEHSASLSYKLLRYVDSALFAVPAPIHSIRQALVMLGLKRIQSCATLLLLTEIDDKPAEMMVMALVRARMCQVLGERLHGTVPQKFFTVGLLSLLDALSDRPMAEVLAEIPLSDDIKDAILLEEGVLGRTLQASKACEEARWEALSESGVEPELAQEAYLDALRWTREVQSALQAPSPALT